MTGLAPPSRPAGDPESRALGPFLSLENRSPGPAFGLGHTQGPPPGSPSRPLSLQSISE